MTNHATNEQQNFLNAVASGDIQDAMAVTDTGDEFNDDPGLLAALVDFVPPESVGTPSTPSPKKKRRMDTSAGVTIWNRKEGV